MGFWKPPVELKKLHKPLMPIVPKRTIPKSFSGERSSDDPPPYVDYEYKAPTLFQEHKVLSLVFIALFVVLALYCYVAVYKPLVYPKPPQPVYIDTVSVPPVSQPEKTP